MAADITTLAGKGSRPHRNVSTKAYRNGYDYWKRGEARRVRNLASRSSLPPRHPSPESPSFDVNAYEQVG